jgi:hypothetical protein
LEELNEDFYMKKYSLFLVVFFVVGCQIVDQSAQKALLLPPDAPRLRDFIILGADQYEGELAAALILRGIKVRPIAIRSTVTDFREIDVVRQYKEAGFRYALRLNIFHEPAVTCVFSTGHKINATVLVIDIVTNDTLAMIRQSGPDRVCPPLTPVWELLAKDLDEMMSPSTGRKL